MSSTSLLPEQSFMDIKSKILNVLMNGFMEAKWGRGPREIPSALPDELLHMYILEYIALHALKQAHSEKKVVDPSWATFNPEYIDERILHLQRVLGNVAAAAKDPYSAFLQDFRLNNSSKALRSWPDHKEVYDKIYTIVTSPSQFVIGQYFAKGVKRKGGRRKTQYRFSKGKGQQRTQKKKFKNRR